MNILVTGATGTVGRDLVDQLITKGLRVRALTRDPDKANLPEQADVVSGDLGNSDALPALLAGIDKAFMLIGPDNGTEFAKAAAAARIRHVVLLSSFTVTMDWPTTSNFIRVHHEVAEKSLIEAGVPSTFLRSSGFAYNFLQWTCALRSQGVVRAPFANTALPLIHPHDIRASSSSSGAGVVGDAQDRECVFGFVVDGAGGLGYVVGSEELQGADGEVAEAGHGSGRVPCVNG